MGHFQRVLMCEAGLGFRSLISKLFCRICTREDNKHQPLWDSKKNYALYYFCGWLYDFICDRCFVLWFRNENESPDAVFIITVPFILLFSYKNKVRDFCRIENTKRVRWLNFCSIYFTLSKLSPRQSGSVLRTFFFNLTTLTQHLGDTMEM